MREGRKRKMRERGREHKQWEKDWKIKKGKSWKFFTPHSE